MNSGQYRLQVLSTMILSREYVRVVAVGVLAGLPLPASANKLVCTYVRIPSRVHYLCVHTTATMREISFSF